MRLWSLHPRLLDSKGLVALWREALLAKHVLEGRTKGYRHHPQLERFKERPDPVAAIHAYLRLVWEEAERRGHSFDHGKFDERDPGELIPVSDGQLAYELQHLHAKLQRRDPVHYARVKDEPAMPHPLFRVEKGTVAGWEKV